MANRHWIYAVVLLVAAAPALRGQGNPATPGLWTGVIINSTCNVDEAFAETPKCTDPAPGAKLILYDDTIRQLYALDPPAPASVKLGDAVSVRGTLEGNTIHGASAKALTTFGLSVGEKASAFSATDQFGKVQTLDTLRGPKGTILLFYRSADWCPYCKGQLIQLQNAKARIEAQGLKLAGISYDSVAILKFFSERRKIEFPLLSDPDSSIIRAYDVLNAEGVGQNKGMARPGYYFVDPKGAIREKFFEAKYRERLTGNNVLTHIFPELGEEVTTTVDAPHLQVTAGQSDRAGVPGNLVTLTADVKLPPGVHVYAPGTEGYKPIKLTMAPLGDFEFEPTAYPKSKILYLDAIKERVPVFEGTFRIRQELRVNSAAPYLDSLGTDGKDVAIKGHLQYQACDRTICFLPATVPVEWRLHVMALDRVRAPDDIRHK